MRTVARNDGQKIKNRIVSSDIYNSSFVSSVAASRGLFYASPQKQIEYFDKALGIKVDNDIWGKWVEAKTRRDLWVHNAGIVNQVYIDKVKEYKLCDFGNEAVIGEQYFNLEHPLWRGCFPFVLL